MINSVYNRVIQFLKACYFSSQPPNTPERTTPQLSSPSVRDEGEEEADERINQLLNTARSPSK